MSEQPAKPVEVLFTLEDVRELRSKAFSRLVMNTILFLLLAAMSWVHWIDLDRIHAANAAVKNAGEAIDKMQSAMANLSAAAKTADAQRNEIFQEYGRLVEEFHKLAVEKIMREPAPMKGERKL